MNYWIANLDRHDGVIFRLLAHLTQLQKFLQKICNIWLMSCWFSRLFYPLKYCVLLNLINFLRFISSLINRKCGKVYIRLNWEFLQERKKRVRFYKNSRQSKNRKKYSDGKIQKVNKETYRSRKKEKKIKK